MGQNKGRGHRILTPNDSILTFWRPNLRTKFHQNQIKFFYYRSTDRQTDRETDRQKDECDFIICPILCYSSGTDTGNLCTVYCAVVIHKFQFSKNSVGAKYG